MTAMETFHVEVAQAALAAVADLLPDHRSLRVAEIAEQLAERGLAVDGQRLMGVLDCLASFGIARIEGHRGQWRRAKE